MQVEHKTEKGVILFADVPDDSLLHHIRENSAGCYLQYICKNENNQITIGTSDYFDKGFVKVGFTSEVTDEQAKMMMKFTGGLWNAYKDFTAHNNWFASSLWSFKSLMQHLQVYEVNPYQHPDTKVRCRDCADGDGVNCDNYDNLLCDPTQHKNKWQEAQERTGKWIVLFKPSKK